MCDPTYDKTGYSGGILSVGHDFPEGTPLISATISSPRAIRGFHYDHSHVKLWMPATGIFQVALVDLRPESPTFGVKNTIVTGLLQPWQMLIPERVGHGYKVIGDGPAIMIQVSAVSSSSESAGYIAWDDLGIAYEWDARLEGHPSH